jgi:hypothetical protein
MVAAKKGADGSKKQDLTKEQEQLLKNLVDIRNALSNLSIPLSAHMNLVQKAAMIEEYLKR